MSNSRRIDVTYILSKNICALDAKVIIGVFSDPCSLQELMTLASQMCEDPDINKLVSFRESCGYTGMGDIETYCNKCVVGVHRHFQQDADIKNVILGEGIADVFKLIFIDSTDLSDVWDRSQLKQFTQKFSAILSACTNTQNAIISCSPIYNFFRHKNHH